MAETASSSATWEDLSQTPDDGRVYEIIAGVLEAFPRPSSRHGRAQRSLGAQVGSPYDDGIDGPGGWWIVVEPDVELRPSDIVAPHLVGWRRERLPDLPASGPVRVIPDWVCEFVSPFGQKRDRIVKANLYLETGIPYYWIVDVRERTLEALSACEDGWLRLGGWTDGDRPRILPFDAVEIDVSRLFPPR